MDRVPSGSVGTDQMPRPSPSMTPQATPYPAASASPAPPINRQSSYQKYGATHPYATAAPQTPSLPKTSQLTAQQQLHPTPALAAAHPTSYAGSTPSQSFSRPTIQATQSQQYSSHPSANAHEPRLTETYVLSDNANSAIPRAIRDQYPQDEQGRVLFFTKPPLDTRHAVYSRDASEPAKPLAHSEAYLSAKSPQHSLKRSISEIDGTDSAPAYKQLRPGTFGEERDADGRIKPDPKKAAETAAAYKARQELDASKIREQWLSLTTRGLGMLRDQIAKGTEDTYKVRYGADWQRIRAEDDVRRAERRIKEEEEEKKQRGIRSKMTDVKNVDMDWHKDFWTGWSRNPEHRGYKDDYDNRLPR